LTVEWQLVLILDNGHVEVPSPATSRQHAEWKGTQLRNTTWRIDTRKVGPWQPYDNDHTAPAVAPDPAPPTEWRLVVIARDGTERPMPDTNTQQAALEVAAHFTQLHARVEWRTVEPWRQIGPVRRTRTIVEEVPPKQPRRRRHATPDADADDVRSDNGEASH
jgi:hypothetical protein